VILVDTSVWVNHLKHNDSHLGKLLMDGEVVCHPFILGELACGGLKNRDEVLGLLKELPQATVIDEAEFHDFVEKQRLWGKGLGFVDVHLLASARVDGIQLWTTDGYLRKVAVKFGVNI
jgi:predicted nucleic acid-binding protein